MRAVTRSLRSVAATRMRRRSATSRADVFSPANTTWVDRLRDEVALLARLPRTGDAVRDLSEEVSGTIDLLAPVSARVLPSRTLRPLHADGAEAVFLRQVVATVPMLRCLSGGETGLVLVREGLWASAVWMSPQLSGSLSRRTVRAAVPRGDRGELSLRKETQQNEVLRGSADGGVRRAKQVADGVGV